MAAVIDDESLRRSKAEAGRRVVEHFDERMLAQQYLDLYAEILSERS
jgi:glycosyltransferase involved in cell wall biosynthesis